MARKILKKVQLNPNQRKFLTDLANRLKPHLKKHPYISLLQNSIHETTTGGIRTSIAQADQIKLELWYDEYAQSPAIRLWYGYYWENRQSFHDAFGHWRDYVQSEFVRGDGDATSTIPYHFKKKLKASEFGRPFLEHYRSSDEYFFGCFDTRSKISQALIGDIKTFFSQTLTDQNTIEIGHLNPSSAKLLERLEVQRLSNALSFDRSSPVAKERKRLDGYKCHICGFNFALTYPGIGAKFAEAHHIKPLGRTKETKVTVTIAKLRTLCANCHRMVHRAESKLKGDPIKHVLRAWLRGSSRK